MHEIACYQQSSEVSKVGGTVDGVVEISREGNKEEGGIEGKPRGEDIGALRGVVDKEK